MLRAQEPVLITSALSVLEVQRGARIADTVTGARKARELLDRLRIVDIDRELLEAAVSYTSAYVRSLDAIHLASLVRVGARRMLVYDRRLAEAAMAVGVETLSPGA